MSGSGGGDGNWRPTGSAETPGTKTGSGSGGGGGGTSGEPCDITELTTLNSPDRTVVATLRIGDVLEVRLQAGPPRQLVAVAGSAVAGSITSPKSAQIIQCISQKGWTYVAEVRSIRGGLCQIEVRPK